MRAWENKLKKKGGALLSVNVFGIKLWDKFLTQKRISSRSSGAGDTGYQASMTVEACFVLPFFLFAFLNVISILELYRLQGNMSAAMHDTAKQMAVYGYEYRELRETPAGAAESIGLTYLYAANKVQRTLGSAYLEHSPIAGGSQNISWIQSYVMREDDCIDLVAEYKIAPPIAVVGYQECTMYNRMRTRAWTGYDNAKHGVGDSTDMQEELVYITPDGEVYHKSKSCTYLKLSITAVDRSFLESIRNSDGGKYYACETCGDLCKNTLYITNYGNRYHSLLGCSKLKRTILSVPISQAGHRGACSKCG